MDLSKVEQLRELVRTGVHDHFTAAIFAGEGCCCQGVFAFVHRLAVKQKQLPGVPV